MTEEGASETEGLWHLNLAQHPLPVQKSKTVIQKVPMQPAPEFCKYSSFYITTPQFCSWTTPEVPLVLTRDIGNNCIQKPDSAYLSLLRAHRVVDQALHTAWLPEEVQIFPAHFHNH